MKPIHVIATIGALLILGLGGWYMYMQSAPVDEPSVPQRGLPGVKTIKKAKAEVKAPKEAEVKAPKEAAAKAEDKTEDKKVEGEAKPEAEDKAKPEAEKKP